MKENSDKGSPLRKKQQNIIKVVDKTKENMLDECRPPSPHKKLPSPVRQTLEKPVYELKLPEHSKITEEEPSTIENTN